MRPPVQGDDHQVVKQMLNVLPSAEAQQEEVDHGTLRCPRLVERCDDDGLVGHRGLGQNGVQLLVMLPAFYLVDRKPTTSYEGKVMLKFGAS